MGKTIHFRLAVGALIWFAALAHAGLAQADPVRTGQAQAGGTITEVVETYRIRGKTGAELYASIGENGPQLGPRRAIAHTRFKLTWRRDYQRRGTDCVLASAVPRLVIITTLPKPAGSLPPDVAKSWDRFITGIRAHEAVHGTYVRTLLAEIETATIGLTQPNDPGCTVIKTEMTKRLGAISDARKTKDRAFDQAEMSEGGTVHQLVLALVNGP